MSINDPPVSGPDLPICPADDCEETDDLMVQECAPGHSWMFTCGRGHWGFITKKSDESKEAR